jgi:Putative glutamine amidotransferase
MEPLKLQLTEYGRTHPLTQLSSEEVQSEQKWKILPDIEEFNWVREAKPGALVLATGNSTRGKAILLAVQRYGRGRSMAFTPSDSWHWQMERSHDDNTYETFWRQALRWLVSSSPDSINLELEKTSFFHQEMIPLNVQVFDLEYNLVNEATVVATIIPPQGSPVIVPMRRIPDQEGRYAAEFAPGEFGVFKIQLAASRNGINLGSTEGHFSVIPDSLEFYDAVQNKTLLKRLSKDTGGNYYTLENASQIPEEMTYIERQNSLPHSLPLWDMPALFLTLCFLLISEWSIRKQMRLP